MAISVVRSDHLHHRDAFLDRGQSIRVVCRPPAYVKAGRQDATCEVIKFAATCTVPRRSAASAARKYLMSSIHLYKILKVCNALLNDLMVF